MEASALNNLLAVSVQIAAVVIAATAAIALLRITSPTLSYLAWRGVLITTLLLPFVQTPQPAPPSEEISIIETTAAAVSANPLPAPTALLAVDWATVIGVIVALGIALRLVWLAAGVVRLRRWRHSGVALDTTQHEDLQHRLGTRAEVFYVPHLRHPATFGLRKPVVLLPVELRERAAAREAVLAHELVHVARRDWAWQAIEECIRAVFWFHPAMWWAITRVQLAREEVVDERAVRVTGNRREYLRALLSFAEYAPPASAPAFARRRHLFRRMVLLSMEDVMSARRIVGSVCAVGVVLLTGAWGAVSAFPTQATQGGVLQSAPGPIERAATLTSPENPVPAVVHAERAVRPQAPNADKADVSVTLRTTIDEAGQVAEVRLTSFTFRLEGETVTTMGGPESVPAFVHTALHEFIAAAADAVRRSRYEAPTRGPAVFTTITQFTRDDTLAATRTVPMVQRVSAEGAIKVGANGIKPPMKVKDVRPVYPQPALDAGVEGVVIMEVRIEPDGRVGSAAVLRSIPALDQSALDAVHQWEFRPTLLNGAPVAVIMTVTVQFTLG